MALYGPNLTPSEKALFTARRKEAYEALHPETKREATLKQNAPSRQVGETAGRFTADTATKTGESERTVQRTLSQVIVLLDQYRTTY